MRQIIIMYLLKLVQVVLVNYLFLNPITATDKIFCYYQSWSPSFSTSDIDVNICTHVNYAFLSIEPNGNLKVDNNNTFNDIVGSLRDLKLQNSNLKLLFSVRRASGNSKIFSEVASNSTKTVNLALSALEFLEAHQFDGIDLNWKYPGVRGGGKAADKENFVDMLKVIRKYLKYNGDYLLTTTVGPCPHNTSYDVPKISDIVDYINVMTFNFHNSSECNKTVQNSPLFPSSKNDPWEKNHTNCHASIENWIKKGASNCKLILGLPFYGHSYQLKNSTHHSLGAAINSDNGHLPYYEICKLRKGWHEIWDFEQKVHYKYNKTTWISFDNPTSIRLKVQYAKKQRLAGVMIWAVNQDDKNGTCGFKNTLLQTVRKYMQAEDESLIT